MVYLREEKKEDTWLISTTKDLIPPEDESQEKTQNATNNLHYTECGMT